MHLNSSIPSFDDIDWVALAGMMGSRSPVILYMLTDEGRFQRADVLYKAVMGNDKLPKNHVRDELDWEIEQGKMTSFDKAWIVLYVNRMKRAKDFLH